MRGQGTKMNRIILIPLLAFLTGCVTHHHHYIQAEQAEDGAYYSDSTTGSPEYNDVPQVNTDYSADYTSVRYYPWWSVDYFYLSPYRHRSGISVGFNIGYGSAWHDPFYWFYEPFSISYSPFYYSYFYAPYRYHDYHHGHYNRFSWYSNYWRYRYHDYHHSRHRDHDTWQRDRDGWGGHDNDGSYAGSFDNRGRREDGRIDPVDRGGDRPGGTQNRPGPEAGINRHVSAVAGSGPGERGMEVRNRQERKPVPTRTEPVKPVRKLSPADGLAATPLPKEKTWQSVKSGAGEIRSYSGSKQTRTKPQPVNPPQVISQAQNAGQAKAGIDKYSQSYRVGPSIQQGKLRQVKPQPVRPGSAADQVNGARNSGSSSYSSGTGPVVRVEPPGKLSSGRVSMPSARQTRPASREEFQPAPRMTSPVRQAPARMQPPPRAPMQAAPAASRQAARPPQSKATQRAKGPDPDTKQRPAKERER